ncbi:ABC transporter ATP-binding protein [Anaerotignum lactatifermentans]|uniref:Simple sugar transport system ATP-binding protein n=1 Tax=Anaerotignum lactatifermentans DSM 14214 TaxID=1121323 RepID=A0A1M6TWU5_9FIRM|nr:ABC transporter ATP-binding protein [Anaerotignum lactatifermentans]SHK61406.1 simple sugar transport system ATP-binding protein [[Clostridium] lactatifermentans DSM 14214] [Anaerotignum lactatifermentans DSM 14214]
MADNEYVVQMKGITKVYPNGIAANQGVDFNVKRGEIHALMGENGAGKSTLMKMLFGLEQPTEGEIYVNGEKVSLTSPTVAISKGIGMVHQHFMLVPNLTVAENMVLGMEPKHKGMFMDYKKAVEITEEYAKKYNLHVDPNAKVRDIPVGMKQKVEILKALVRGAKILILDEPTAVLTTQETEELFKELIHLKEQGYTMIFISHKLHEIKQITDRLTIMRSGKSMGVYQTADISKEEISRLMVGRDVILTVEKDQAQPTDVVLRVRDLEYTNEWNKKMLNKLSFDVRKGEILGIAGVEGNGQRELVDMLFNLNTPDSGTATVNGQSVIGQPQRKIRDLGVSLIPEDRMTFGMAGTATIEENLMSDRSADNKYNNGPLFNMKKMHEDSDQLIKDYKVLCKSRNQQVGMLSGGNIQKVVVAREFSADPILIIADQPTRGIDVGATEFIRKKLVELSRAGAAVLLVSADLNEVMELSDSLIIMYNGGIAAYFEDTTSLTDAVMGEYMLGLKQQSDEEVRRVQHGE